MRRIISNLTSILVMVSMFIAPLPGLAKLPANCIDRLVDKSEQHLKELEETLAIESKKTVDHFTALDNKWKEFAGYFKGAWAKECLDVVPKNLETFNNFQEKHITPMWQAVGVKLRELCSAATQERIDYRVGNIKKFISKGNQRNAEREFNAFKQEISQKPYIARCTPKKEELEKLVSIEIPGLLGDAGSQDELNVLANNFPMVAKGWNTAQEALAAQIEAPGYLTGTQGQTDFRNAVNKCLKAIKTLRAAGKTETTPITFRDGGSATLGEITSLINKTASDLDGFFARIVQNNKEFRGKSRQAWIDANVHGSAMKDIFTSNKKIIPRVEKMGNTIMWKYRSYTTGAIFHECKEYVFDASGKKVLSHQTFKCE